MNTSAAFAPAHITGLFTIEHKKNSLETGSRGAGVSIAKGVFTTVRATKASKWKIRIYINKVLAEAKVSLTVVKQFFSLTKTKYEIQINHNVQVPIGAGYGTSGAGALSLALALNEIFGSGLSRIEAAQLAHIAEVKCKTGLGTVIAETFGGIEIRDKAGAPGVGSLVKIKNSNQKILSIFFNHFYTHTFLTNLQMQARINMIGNKLLHKLIKEPSVENLLILSHKFSDELDMYTPKLRKLLSYLDDYAQNFSMNMFGEALFSIVDDEMLESLKPALEKAKSLGGQIILSDIDDKGARLT